MQEVKAIDCQETEEALLTLPSDYISALEDALLVDSLQQLHQLPELVKDWKSHKTPRGEEGSSTTHQSDQENLMFVSHNGNGDIPQQTNSYPKPPPEFHTSSTAPQDNPPSSVNSNLPSSSASHQPLQAQPLTKDTMIVPATTTSVWLEPSFLVALFVAAFLVVDKLWGGRPSLQKSISQSSISTAGGKARRHPSPEPSHPPDASSRSHQRQEKAVNGHHNEQQNGDKANGHDHHHEEGSNGTATTADSPTSFASSLPSKYHDPYSVIANAQEERITNLIAQNSLLHKALEEQRVLTTKIHKELAEKVQTQVDASHGQTLKDLTAQVVILQQQREDDKRRALVEAADHGVLVQKVATLTEMVKTRDNTWQTMEESQAAFERLLQTKFQALQEETQRETTAQLLAYQNEATSVQEKVAGFGTKLKAIQQDLTNRSAQMAKLGQYLKARDEKVDVKSSTMEDKVKTMAEKLEGLTEEVQTQWVHATNVEQQMSATCKQSAESIEDILSKVQLHCDAQDKELYSFQKTLKDDFDSEMEGVKADLKKLTSSMTGKSQSRIATCEAEIAKLKTQCSAQAKKEAAMASEMQELSDNLVSRNDLLDTIQVHEGTMMNKIESMMQEAVSTAVNDQSERWTEHKEEDDLEEQFFEISNKLESIERRQDFQDSRFENLRAENQDKLTKLTTTMEADRAKLNESLEEDSQWKGRVATVEKKCLGLQEQVESVSIELQERLDYEFVIIKAGCRTEAKKTQKALETVEKLQRLRAANLEERTADLASQTKELTTTVTKRNHDVDELRRFQVAASNSLDNLRTKTMHFEDVLAKSEEKQGVLLSKVDALSSDYNKISVMLSSTKQDVVDTNNVLSDQAKGTKAKLEAVDAKLEQVDESLERQETETRRNLETAEQQRLNLARQVQDLSVQVHQQCESSFEHQKEYHTNTAELSAFVERLNAKVEHHATLHKGKVDKVALRVNKVEKELQDVTKGETTKEAQPSRQVEANSAASGETGTPADVESATKERVENWEPAQKEEAKSPSQGAAGKASEDVTDAASVSMASLSSTEERYVSLSTKLVSFSVELQRREDRVSALEKLAKDKSDSYSSQAEVLNNEIELQRQQLKKWDDTTHKNEARYIEAQRQVRELGMAVHRCREEFFLSDERVTDIDDALEEECMSTSVRSRLGSKRRQQEEQRDECKVKLSDMEKTLNRDKAECSKLASKQELYEGELDRRRSGLETLRSSLSNILESVAEERESLHSELVSLREDRDSWKANVSDIVAVLESIERDCPSVERLQSLPAVEEARAIRGGGTAAIQGSNTGESKDQHSQKQKASEGRLEKKANPLDDLKTLSTIGSYEQDASVQENPAYPHVVALSETTEALGRQLQESTSQCQQLAEKVEKIEIDLEWQEKQVTEMEALRREVESNENQMVSFKEDQISLKTDIYRQVDTLRKKLQALEERYQAASRTSQSQPPDGVDYQELFARVGELATQFKDHGDIVAKVGALADSIQACESRLASFEKQQDDTRADVSSMIDFFKTDLQSLKQLCQEAVARKDAEFAGLLSQVESLMAVSQAQGKRFEAMEVRLDTANQEIQTGHLVEQMKEKYIDLAAKVELLTIEIGEGSELRENLESRAKDRESLYLTQLNAVRQDFESQQSKYEHQVQLRIYNAMVYLLQCIAKREGRASAFPVWSSREESLALQHRQMIMAGEDGRRAGHGHQRNLGVAALGGKSSGTGFSMASGIIRANMMRSPVMLSPNVSPSASSDKADA